MRLPDVERELRRHGYDFLYVRGSHRQYRHMTTGRRLTVTAHGGIHCHFSWRRLAEIRQDLERMREAS